MGLVAVTKLSRDGSGEQRPPTSARDRRPGHPARPVGSTAMILVDTFVTPSPTEGVGIFASQAIAARTCIWKFDVRFDRLFGEARLTDLSEASRRVIERYA